MSSGFSVVHCDGDVGWDSHSGPDYYSSGLRVIKEMARRQKSFFSRLFGDDLTRSEKIVRIEEAKHAEGSDGALGIKLVLLLVLAAAVLVLYDLRSCDPAATLFFGAGFDASERGRGLVEQQHGG